MASCMREINNFTEANIRFFTLYLPPKDWKYSDKTIFLDDEKKKFIDLKYLYSLQFF